MNRIAPADDRQVTAFACNPAFTKRDHKISIGFIRLSLDLAIQTLVLQEDHRVPRTCGHLYQSFGIFRATGENHSPSGDVREDAFHAGRVPRATFDISASRDPHHYRAVPCALTSPPD